MIIIVVILSLLLVLLILKLVLFLLFVVPLREPGAAQPRAGGAPVGAAARRTASGAAFAGKQKYYTRSLLGWLRLGWLKTP